MLQRAARLPSRALVHVHSPCGSFDATIGNISQTGARLLGVPEDMLSVGEKIVITCQTRRHRAQVRWHFDDTCGLMFERPLKTDEIDAIRSSRWDY